MNPLLATLEGSLIVSCQAYPGEPMRDPDTMARVAQSAVLGGAGGIRAQGLDDIARIRANVDVPIVGLWKIGAEGVFITPTIESALAVSRAGAHIVALDATRRERPDGEMLRSLIEAVHAETDSLVLGDVGSESDARYAIECGVDAIATTLAGYTAERPRADGPDLELIGILTAFSPVPVIAEGRIHTPGQAKAAKDAGAHAVVVGTAITHPRTLTEWFRSAVDGGL
jgi:N-acylglucosamine-6-phosphate 2-epimerase